MAIREVPKSFIYKCDICGAEHEQKNADGHYTDSRPSHWANLSVKQDAYDLQGNACADGSVHRLLCDDCRSGVIKAINDYAALRAQGERR